MNSLHAQLAELLAASAGPAAPRVPARVPEEERLKLLHTLEKLFAEAVWCRRGGGHCRELVVRTRPSTLEVLEVVLERRRPSARSAQSHRQRPR